MGKIRIACDASVRGDIPQIKPASKAIPDYFKNMPRSVNSHPASRTVKRCIPFFEAMTSGYIVPLWADLFVTAINGNIDFSFPINFPIMDGKAVDAHEYNQIEGYPLKDEPYGKIVLKVSTPWAISTDDGISCLLTSPLNRFEKRFKLIDGVIDTDAYYSNLNIPLVWTGGDGEFFIPRGTPIAQIIPFKREEFEVEYCDLDQEKKLRTKKVLGSYMRDGYRSEFWSKRKQGGEQ